MARIEDGLFHSISKVFGRESKGGDSRSDTQAKLGVQNIGKFSFDEKGDNSGKIFTSFTQFTSSRRF